MNEVESKNQGIGGAKIMKRDELNKELIVWLRDCIDSMQKIRGKVSEAIGQVGLCDDLTSEYYKKSTMKAVDKRIYAALHGSCISLGLMRQHYQSIVDCLENMEKGEIFDFPKGFGRY